MVTNNGAASGTPANAATMMGTIQAPQVGLPVLEFDSADFPQKTQNMQNGMTSNPMQLSRETKKSTIRRNRRAACKGVAKGPPGTSLDEFPFASSTSGGAGASVAPIDVNEQCRQGGKMSAFYQKHGLTQGSPYLVKVI
jgi:hypothetical protein